MSASLIRRATTRLSGDTMGPLKLLGQPHGWALIARVRDVSIQGIGLLLDQAVPSETSLLIEAGPSGKALDAELKATVCHATPLANGEWLIGCRFSRCLTAEDFQVLA